MCLMALRHANYLGLDDGMHPEDWAAALSTVMEAVGIGFAEGYRRGKAASQAETVAQTLAER